MGNNPELKVISLQITTELWEELMERAQREAESYSTIVRLALKEYLHGR